MASSSVSKRSSNSKTDRTCQQWTAIFLIAEIVLFIASPALAKSRMKSPIKQRVRRARNPEKKKAADKRNKKNMRKNQVAR